MNENFVAFAELSSVQKKELTTLDLSGIDIAALRAATYTTARGTIRRLYILLQLCRIRQ